MNIPIFTSKTFAALSRSVDWMFHGGKEERFGNREKIMLHRDFVLRNSAAFALSCYWAHHHEEWLLMLFRDASGVIRHIACEAPDRTFVDAYGRCTEEQIALRLGMLVYASHCEEMDVLQLLGPNPAVLDAADDLRRRAEYSASWQKAAKPVA